MHVILILEEYGGKSDLEVLKLSYQNNYLLLTEDKDFGEIVNRFEYEHKGIILIRHFEINRYEKIILVTKIIENLDRFPNHFSVISEQGLRIR